eukprot:8004092-Alexandrium_andersonii.AAC.1
MSAALEPFLTGLISSTVHPDWIHQQYRPQRSLPVHQCQPKVHASHPECPSSRAMLRRALPSSPGR